MVIGLILLRNERSAQPLSSPLRSYLAVLGVLLILSLPLGEWVSLVAIPFAILVYELALGQSMLARILSTPFMVLLGSASYAIYLLQFPIRSWTRVAFLYLPEKLASFGTPITPAVLVLCSVFLFKFWEEPCRKALRSWFAAWKVPATKNRRSHSSGGTEA
jgi:peptidoglycan/LPS O-acetylase OafA/YrhL